MKNYILSFGLLFTTLIAVNSASAQEHRPVSDQAKGAIVGGAAGAVAGGLIGHNVKGALIGTAIGAGGGYIVGDAVRRKKLKKRQAYLRAHPVHHYAASKTTVKPKSVTTTTVTKTTNY